MTGVKRPSFEETLVFSRGAGILGEKKILENFVGNHIENTIECMERTGNGAPFVHSGADENGAAYGGEGNGYACHPKGEAGALQGALLSRDVSMGGWIWRCCACSA